MFSKTLLFNVILGLSLWIQNSSSQLFLNSYDFRPPPYVTWETGRSIQPVKPGLAGDWTIAGYTFALGINDTNQGSWFLQKLDLSGNVLCLKRLTTRMMSGIQEVNIRHDSCFSHVRLSQMPVFVLGGSYARPAPLPLGLREKAAWSMMDTACNHVMTQIIADTLCSQYRSVTKDKFDNFINAGYIETYFSNFPKPFPNKRPSKILISKYSSVGGFIWANRYLPPYNGQRHSNDIAYSVCYQPKDNSFGITGTTDYFTGSGGRDIFIMKINGAGTPIWFKVYKQSISQNTQITESRGIVALPDGGFGITGWTNVSDPGKSDILLLTVNSTGGVTWFFTHGFTGRVEQGQSLIYNPTDSFFTITGNMTNFMTFNPNAYWAKIQAFTGTIAWFKYYSDPNGHDVGYDLDEVPGTVPGYAFTGETFQLGGNSRDVYFARTDNIGSIIDGCPVLKVLEEPSIDLVEDSLIISTEPVFDTPITPYIDSPPVTPAVLCSQGSKTFDHSINNANEYELGQNYPNPFNPVTSISFSLPVDGYVTIKVYNVLGEEIKVLLHNEYKTAGVYDVQFDGTNLASGIYFYEIKANNFTSRRKMLLIK